MFYDADLVSNLVAKIQQNFGFVKKNLHLFSFQFFQRLAQLVGARGDFTAAADAFEFADNVVDPLPFHQSADSLQVSVATAEKCNILDDVVIVGCYIDED